jgi:hypothetical protein
MTGSNLPSQPTRYKQAALPDIPSHRCSSVKSVRRTDEEGQQPPRTKRQRQLRRAATPTTKQRHRPRRAADPGTEQQRQQRRTATPMTKRHHQGRWAATPTTRQQRQQAYAPRARRSVCTPGPDHGAPTKGRWRKGPPNRLTNPAPSHHIQPRPRPRCCPKRTNEKSRQQDGTPSNGGSSEAGPLHTEASNGGRTASPTKGTPSLQRLEHSSPPSPLAAQAEAT